MIDVETALRTLIQAQPDAERPAQLEVIAELEALASERDGGF